MSGPNFSKRPLLSTNFLILLCLLLSLSTAAQTRFSINGTIKDTLSGETLIGASIKLREIPASGTTSNTYGFYSISAAPGEYTLVVSYTGYQTINTPITLTNNVTLDINLNPNALLKEVIVSSRPVKEQIRDPQMGIEKLNMESIKNVPVLFGEKDILKTIQLLPGIKSAGEGNSGFYVRGGSADQNLILLDEANVYNASHLLGFFSTFNSDAIKDVSVYKGGMPAQYGGRLASVVDIRMNEGNRNRYTAEGGIGLIASRLKLEGPVKKGRGSFMLSGRRTYADLFLKLSSDTVLKTTQLYFYDLNAKANYRINDKNVIYLSGYFGNDALGLRETFSLNWGNTTATMRWNHLFSERMFSNTTLIYSDYNYAIENFDNQSDFKVTSRIRDWNLKQDYQYFGSDQHTLKFGLNVNHHQIKPGSISSSSTSSVNDKEITRRRGLELAAYISDEWKLERFGLVYGLRLSSFSLLGPGTFASYDQNGNIIRSQSVGSGKAVKSYLLPEPRISASYQLNPNISLKTSYTRNTQSLHLLSNSTSSLPTDLWVMSSNNIRPQVADQLALGYYQNFKDDQYEFSSEVYFKSMKNQIDYKNAANLRGNENVESELLFGYGRAYGIEFFLKKRTGKFNGWLGYTLSRTERKFDEISNGDYFPAKQDRTHDLSLVGIYNISKRWTFSGTFIYNTGNAITFPSGKYTLDGRTMFYYTERNGYRMPDYHRLDINATLDGKPGKKYQSSWTFGVYNAYNRQNAYIIDFRDNPDDPSRTQAVQTSLFGIIPSVTWNFKF
ncbi:carboxypeptidase-like regulatory domain-containing protein [Paradesertivirga mongoliensis]|uniref:Carboxypeptidase-like regulatory domain-containing protein n=1 Tax=Paradesertivirga mongoliensis TaxID=2100740 RepID=A0ABW4ZNL3_9SPHI|nr:TonB-dependent receptor [Pedobacter mongoliensis]